MMQLSIILAFHIQPWSPVYSMFDCKVCPIDSEEKDDCFWRITETEKEEQEENNTGEPGKDGMVMCKRKNEELSDVLRLLVSKSRDYQWTGKTKIGIAY